MKKLLIPVVILVVLVAAVAVGWRWLRPSVWREVQTAELIPANAMALVEIQDIWRSYERFPKLAVSKLWQDPAMQEMVKKPMDQLMASKDKPKWLDQLAAIKPRSAFAAMLPGGDKLEESKFLIGLRYAGARDQMEALRSEALEEFKKKHPAHKAEVLTHANIEVKSYTDGTLVLAEAFASDWYFVGSDVAALKDLLDRYTGAKKDAPSLAQEGTFKAATKPLLKESDASLYVHWTQFFKYLEPMLKGQMPPGQEQAMEEMRKMQGISACLKMDGEEFHELFHVYGPGMKKLPTLPLQTLSLTTSDTLFYYAAAASEEAANGFRNNPTFALIPAIAEIEKALAAKQLSLADIIASLGPEVSLSMDWGAAPMPGVLIAAELKDRNKIKTALGLAFQGLPPEVVEGSDVWVLPIPGLAFQPAAVLTDKYVLLGMGREAVLASAARAKGKAENSLASTDSFKAAKKGLPEPANAFGYLHMGKLLEKTYGTARPMVAMMLAMNAEAAKYVDAGKLPPPEVFSKYLGASGFASSQTSDGAIVESRGAVTFLQGIFVGGVAGGVGYATTQQMKAPARRVPPAPPAGPAEDAAGLPVPPPPKAAPPVPKLEVPATPAPKATPVPAEA